MWDVLKETDIEQARQQIQLCRDETLRRHAEEIQRMDADQDEIDTLDRLIDAFSGKFKMVPTPPEAPPIPAERYEQAVLPPAKRDEHPVLPPVKRDEHPVLTPVKRDEHPVLTSHRVDKPSHRVRHPDRTNFDTFSRAMAKVERGW